MKWMLALTMYALLNGCANQTELAKQSLTEEVRSEYPVEFRNVANYPGGVSCGEYISYDKWGLGGKPRPFVVKDGEANKHPLALDVEVFCSEDSAARLYSKLGINSSDSFQSMLVQTRRDFHEIHGALESFYQTNYRYPNMAEGLEALVMPERYYGKRGPLKNGGYLETLPLDHWNRAYQYHLSGLAGVKRNPEILTLGADDAVGGKDQDADLKSSYVKYLDHILAM